MKSKVEHLAEGVDLWVGDCLKVLPALPDNSVDACVTDPPYHLTTAAVSGEIGHPSWNDKNKNDRAKRKAGFMGKKWDGGDIAFQVDLWREVYRVLKPGGHLVAFGGTRTYHRMACAIEDANFEIRDQIQWLYGSGFPKSHDVSKGIDRVLGAERKVIIKHRTMVQGGGNSLEIRMGEKRVVAANITAPATAAAAATTWDGWGTALKPACEPIVLARKPLSEKSVAANVLRWGTGALNIDGCRVEALNGVAQFDHFETGSKRGYDGGIKGSKLKGKHFEGRWPANIIHDGSDEVTVGFPSSSSRGVVTSKPGKVYGGGAGLPSHTGVYGFDDSGLAARFFYTAKADQDDRLKSKHPTVKPVDLIAYLCRLVAPPNGIVLDPFAGSGTLAAACAREGLRGILIEREAEYVEDIKQRIEHELRRPVFFNKLKPAPKKVHGFFDKKV